MATNDTKKEGRWDSKYGLRIPKDKISGNMRFPG